MDLTALRQTVAQITASQDQMARKVDRLQAANRKFSLRSQSLLRRHRLLLPPR